MNKPDPRIFQLALKKMNVTAEEGVFLDDIGGNLKGAASVGLKTILVKPKMSEETIKQLEGVLAVNLLQELQNKAKL
jgi:FMN phosphatase YigB (HAD superfamily)